MWVGGKNHRNYLFSFHMVFLFYSSLKLALSGTLSFLHSLYRYSLLLQSHSFFLWGWGGKKEEGIITQTLSVEATQQLIMTRSALLILAALVGSCAQFTGKVQDVVLFTFIGSTKRFVRWIICCSRVPLSEMWLSRVMRSEWISHWIASLLLFWRIVVVMFTLFFYACCTLIKHS